jgi:hypothetical protein
VLKFIIILHLVHVELRDAIDILSTQVRGVACPSYGIHFESRDLSWDVNKGFLQYSLATIFGPINH